jgi:Caspase domain
MVVNVYTSQKLAKLEKNLNRELPFCDCIGKTGIPLAYDTSMKETKTIVHCCLVVILIPWLLACSGQSADIVALCIGNDAYHAPEDRLDTPVADAFLMKQALEALPGGADVKLLTDASRSEIVIALNELKARSVGAKLALVFYSGHGMDGQPRGYENPDTFLIPVEAQIPDEDHLAASAVGLREVLSALKDCPVTARAVILDCCRTGAPKAAGPLVAGGVKNFGKLDERVKLALGKAVVPDATLVAFAASPGRKAAAYLHEQDKNSPFTKYLVEQLGSGFGNLRDLVEAAAEQTELATAGSQVPYVRYDGAANAIKKIVLREGPGQGHIVPVAMVAANAPLERVITTTIAPPFSTMPSAPAWQGEDPAPYFGPQRYLTLSKLVSDGLEIRTGPDLYSSANILGLLQQQHHDRSLRQISDTVYEGGSAWVEIEVEGWVIVKNQSQTFLTEQLDGTWLVDWDGGEGIVRGGRKFKNNRRNKDAKDDSEERDWRADPLWMRTDSNTDAPIVCGLAFGAQLQESERDFSDPHYHYILGRLSGWTVMVNSDKQVYLREYSPE